MSRITNDPKILHEWEAVGNVMVTRTGGEIPDALWQPFIADLISKKSLKIFSLVVGPANINAAQRKSGAETFRSRGIQATVVVDHAATRGVLTALSWLGVSIKGFAWADLDKAVLHVGATKEEEIVLRNIAARCRKEVR
jgi:hypothetical protein